MTDRPFTIRDYLEHRFEHHEPDLLCRATSKREHAEWRRRFVRRLKRALGRGPNPVALNPEKVLEVEVPGEDVAVRAEKIVFDSSPGMSVPAWVLLPPGCGAQTPAPAVFLIVGHSGENQQPHGRIVDQTSGKAWGEVLLPDGSPCGTRYHNDIGQHLARAGFVVYCQDFLGFGERAGTPHYMRNLWNHCCNLVNEAFVLFDEINLPGVHFHDVQRGLEYLASRPDVDARRIGMIGCSLGGMWTSYVSAIDRRIKAAVSVCSYPNLRYHVLGEKLGLCGAQTIPGIAAFADLATPMSAIAPRPLLVQIGKHDPGMSPENARQPCESVLEVYRMLGREDRFAIDEFDGAHEINVKTAVGWFRQWL